MRLDWNNREQIFIFILILNLIVSVIYLIWGLAAGAGYKKSTRRDDRGAYFMRFIVMLLCPVIGPLFYLFGHIFYLLVFRREADLEDVIFNKERINVRMFADEDRERDIIPIEEAVLVNENKDLRSVMMNVLRGDISESLASITLALTSEDSEASHYAASVLSGELNKFRLNVQRIRKELKEHPEETEYAELLIEYMDGILKQRIFSPFEQRKFVDILDETAELLYESDPSKLNIEKYEALCLRPLEIKDYEKSEKWTRRLSDHYPEELASYTCRLKLYFAERNKEAFFDTLGKLKKSNVIIDNETLELIRVFG